MCECVLLLKAVREEDQLHTGVSEYSYTGGMHSRTLQSLTATVQYDIVICFHSHK